MKERRCLKFTCYIYIPEKEDLGNKLKVRNYLSSLGMGRIQFFDEQGQKKSGKMNAFASFGQMLAMVCNEFSKRAKRRLK
jgi:hypothetical protein